MAIWTTLMMIKIIWGGWCGKGKSMLYITFEEPEDLVISVDSYFDEEFEPDWLKDELVIKIIKDVDKNEVLSPNCLQSPVFGQIPPRDLSGGTKALILMLKTDYLVWASACGDNCAKWIYEISKIKDITISLSHLMIFDEVEAICLDNKKEIHNQDDFRRCLIECLLKEDESL